MIRFKCAARDRQVCPERPVSGLDSTTGVGVCRRAAPLLPTMLAQTTRSRPVALPPSSSTSRALKFAYPGPTSGAAGQPFLAMPFDALRFQYASAVMAGLAQRSIIASGKLERTLDALEKLILGPLARQR